MTLCRRLKLAQELGRNLFKFGMVGSTDSHSSLPSTADDNWWGKSPALEPIPECWKDVVIKSSMDAFLDRTALWDALA